NHPELGPIEIGGWNRFHAFGNPPPQFLEREVARFPRWLLWQALLSPKLELVTADALALGEGAWRVRLVVQNTGWLPRYVSTRAQAQCARRCCCSDFGKRHHGTSARLGRPVLQVARPGTAAGLVRQVAGYRRRQIIGRIPRQRAASARLYRLEPVSGKHRLLH